MLNLIIRSASQSQRQASKFWPGHGARLLIKSAVGWSLAYTLSISPVVAHMRFSSFSDSVAPNTNEPRPDGIRLGAFSDFEFVEWLSGKSDYGPTDARSSTVRDISWWSSKVAPWHHQFVVATIDLTHTPGNDRSPYCYRVRIERLGKILGPGGIAKQQILVEEDTGFEGFLVENKLICALTMASISNPTHTASVYKIPNHDKVQGPPPTLGDLATYARMIALNIPQYDVRNDNCYFFSRMLLHVIVLRHYGHYVFVELGQHNSSENHTISPHDLPLAFGSRTLSLTEGESIVVPGGSLEYPPTSSRLPPHELDSIVLSNSVDDSTLSSSSMPKDPVWIKLLDTLKGREEAEGTLMHDKITVILVKTFTIICVVLIMGSVVGGLMLIHRFPNSTVMVSVAGVSLIAVPVSLVVLLGLLRRKYKYDKAKVLERLMERTEAIIRPHFHDQDG